MFEEEGKEKHLSLVSLHLLKFGGMKNSGIELYEWKMCEGYMNNDWYIITLKEDLELLYFPYISHISILNIWQYIRNLICQQNIICSIIDYNNFFIFGTLAFFPIF